MSKVIITTAGSLGDLYPFMAIARGLKDRGHEVVVATSPCYEQRVAAAGLGYHPLRPDSNWLDDPVQARRFSHPRLGLVRVGRELFMKSLRQSYSDTLEAAAGADLLVSMLATYATRLVAEKQRIPWVSAVHIPMGFFSAYDPPILEVSPFMSRQLRALGPAFWRPSFWVGKRCSRFLASPWYRLRSEIGLPKTTEPNPLVDSHSPLLVLALFSKALASDQPDWPPNTLITGFPEYESNEHAHLPEAVEQFLTEGSKPIVFTLGSAVSLDAQSFFKKCIECAEHLKRRAVLVTGRTDPRHIPTSSPSFMTTQFAPFRLLFNRVAAVVHHGGIGTTGLALRAGLPMLIIPHAWDQWDNAARAERLGVARSILSHKFTSKRAAHVLRILLDDPQYSERGRLVADQVRHENGVKASCDALDKILERPILS